VRGRRLLRDFGASGLPPVSFWPEPEATPAASGVRCLGSPGLVSLDAAGRLVAVEKRELNVHKDDIGMMRGSGGQRPLAVSDLEDFVPGMDKQIAEDTSIVLLSSTTRIRLVMRSPLADV
jgi:hypothetical protein